MFRRGMNIALAVTMLIVGTPHALCMCKRASAAQGAVVRKCPHCRPKPGAPTGCPLNGCKCGACEVIPGAPPVQAVAVPQPDRSPLDAVAHDLLPIEVAVCLEREEGRAAGPPTLPATAGRAIPIFLGHLLF